MDSTSQFTGPMEVEFMEVRRWTPTVILDITQRLPKSSMRNLVNHSLTPAMLQTRSQLLLRDIMDIHQAPRLRKQTSGTILSLEAPELEVTFTTKVSITTPSLLNHPRTILNSRRKLTGMALNMDLMTTPMVNKSTVQTPNKRPSRLKLRSVETRTGMAHRMEDMTIRMNPQ